MAQNTSYPEPELAREPMLPFYNQHQMPPAEHSHIPHPAEASMRSDSHGSGNFLQGNGHLTGPRQPSTPQQLAQRSLDVDQAEDQINPDPSSRKRSKVSRACDECRRKKIRCDAESETPGTACSACQRAGQTCDFSRAPQKRGPSKGYIKELAERVNYLEYSYKTGAPPPPEMQYGPPIAQEHPGIYPPPPQNEYGGRKRDYDTFDGPAPYDNGYNSIQEYISRSQRTHPDIPTGDQSNTGALQQTTNAPTQSYSMNAVAENEKLVDAYYELIHPLFPLLPSTKERMQYDVERVPAGLLEAFFAVLEVAVTACSSTHTEPYYTSANQQLRNQQAEDPKARTPLSSLVYLQALILMIIATENSGPSFLQNNHWFGLAITTATNMKLHLPWPQETGDLKNDPNSNAKLGRRAWLILFILDSWHAPGTFGPLLVPVIGAKLVDSDLVLLGAPAYHMFRLSRILGHLSDGVLYHQQELAIPVYAKGGLLNAALEGELDFFRESMTQHFKKMPSVHLAFLHVQHFADRILYIHEPKVDAIVPDALHIVSVLKTKKGIYYSPLIHHITALATITLAEATDPQELPKTTAALHDLRSGLDATSFRYGNAKTAWDSAISAFITKKLESGPQLANADAASDRGGLEHLADAAVGKSKAANAESDDATARGSGLAMEWSGETSKGYLDLFE